MGNPLESENWLNNNVESFGNEHPQDKKSKQKNPIRGWTTAMRVKIEAFFRGKRFDTKLLGDFVAKKLDDGTLTGMSLRRFGKETIKKAIQSLYVLEVSKLQSKSDPLALQNVLNKVETIAKQAAFHANTLEKKQAIAQAFLQIQKGLQEKLQIPQSVTPDSSPLSKSQLIPQPVEDPHTNLEDLVSALNEFQQSKTEPFNADLNSKLFGIVLDSLSKKNVDTRIFVKDPSGFPEQKSYSIATQEQITGTKLVKDASRRPSDLHTTTLANIIATNELKFSPEQVCQLMRKLMEVQADFSATDYTNYQGEPTFYSVQNNPLKSLIAEGSGNKNYDAVILELIHHIKNREDLHVAQILNAENNFPEPMSTVCFLLRQGKEDIAIKAIEAGADVAPEDLELACKSFGSSTKERPEGVGCIELILKKLDENGKRIPRQVQHNCLQGLMFGSNEWAKEIMANQKELFRKGSLNQNDTVVEKANETLQWDKIRLTDACISLKNSPEDTGDGKILLAEFVTLFLERNPYLDQRFTDLYRERVGDDPLQLSKSKYEYVKDEPGRSKLADLINLFQKRSRRG